ncbi:hypothetical protein J6590_006896 [Homalodisca vitripennis]|nr:hypothetical protein J6590_006896 [Homalodisca vitripennis]
MRSPPNLALTANRWYRGRGQVVCPTIKIASLNGRKSSREHCRNQSRTVVYKRQTASRSNQPRSSVFVIRAALVGRRLEISSDLRSTIYLNDFYAHLTIVRTIRTFQTK